VSLQTTDVAHILMALADGPAHGYAVVGKLREASGGTFDLPQGTVYPGLHRLERAVAANATRGC